MKKNQKFEIHENEPTQTEKWKFGWKNKNIFSFYYFYNFFQYLVNIYDKRSHFGCTKATSC